MCGDWLLTTSLGLPRADTIYTTKGTHYKKPSYRAKGRMSMLVSRTCHLMVGDRLASRSLPHEHARVPHLPPYGRRQACLKVFAT
jgi:hypothetical protein